MATENAEDSRAEARLLGPHSSARRQQARASSPSSTARRQQARASSPGSTARRQQVWASSPGSAAHWQQVWSKSSRSGGFARNQSIKVEKPPKLKVLPPKKRDSDGKQAIIDHNLVKKQSKSKPNPRLERFATLKHRFRAKTPPGGFSDHCKSPRQAVTHRGPPRRAPPLCHLLRLAPTHRTTAPKMHRSL